MNLQQTWIKYGIIMALTTIAMTILFFYLVDTGLFMQSLFMYGAMILIMVLAGLEYRREHGNTMLYGEAFKVTFLTTIVGMILSSIFSYVLLNFIDPDMMDVMVEKAIDSTESLMRSVGAPEDQVDEALAKLENEMPNQFTLVGTLKNMLNVFIIGAILSAIVSIFLRKEESPV